jgi:predicted nuclease of restriction endonuclease-like (RecB) superfamily
MRSGNESNRLTKRSSLPGSYPALLRELKQRIQQSQARASISVNRELVLLYWHIGQDILVRQGREHWGAKVIDRLAADLKEAFSKIKGFSPRNLKYMRAFAEAWPDEEFVQQAVAQIPWGHNVRILDYVKDPSHREWYIRATLEHGWSRDVLVHQIERGLHRRTGAVVTNFERTLPPPQSGDFFNVFNHPLLNLPNATTGLINKSSQPNAPRIIQNSASTFCFSK